MNIAIKHKIYMFLSLTSVLLCLIIIFILSSQPATESNRLSTKVTELVIEKVNEIVPLEIENSNQSNLVNKLNHIIRKFAHFFMYFVLGILFIITFRIMGVKGCKAFIFSFIFCAIYAISDEVHQLFVPGRGAQIRDVIIDSTGAAIGILVCDIGIRLSNSLKRVIRQKPS